MTGYFIVLIVLAVGIVAGFIGRGEWDKRQARKLK